jgi:phosphopantothenate-cysteine ligase
MDAENRLEGEGKTLETQVKAFFDSAPPLHSSSEITQKLNQFIQRNSSSSGKLVSTRTFKFTYIFLCCFLF